VNLKHTCGTSERGAAEVACVYSARYAREFIADCFGDKVPQFSSVRASTITEVLAARADRWTPGSMKVAAVSSRRFFRYLQMVGQIDGGLAPTIAGWRLASVPRVLTDQQVAALVLRHRSIDTAAIYAKVDISALRNVAAPWPGSSR
jgi:site-specific recombinase XerD